MFIFRIEKLFKLILVKLDGFFPEVMLKTFFKIIVLFELWKCYILCDYLIWGIPANTQNASIISHFCLSSFEIAY